MDQLAIFNLALSLHDKTITQDDLDASSQSKEVRLCKQFEKAAILRALREADWSFFTQKLTIDYDDDEAGWGYLHGYALPDNLFKHVPVNDEPFQIAGSRYYCDADRPQLYGILVNCFDTMIHPEEFDMLVAYALSYELCGLLSPGSGLDQIALQKYSWSLNALIGAECHNNYRERYRE